MDTTSSTVCIFSSSWCAHLMFQVARDQRASAQELEVNTTGSCPMYDASCICVFSERGMPRKSKHIIVLQLTITFTSTSHTRPAIITTWFKTQRVFTSSNCCLLAFGGFGCVHQLLEKMQTVLDIVSMCEPGHCTSC